MAFFDSRLNLALALIRFESTSIVQLMVRARKYVTTKQRTSEEGKQLIHNYVQHELECLVADWTADGRINKHYLVECKYEPDFTASRAERVVSLELTLTVGDIHTLFQRPDKAKVLIAISDAEGVQFKVLE